MSLFKCTIAPSACSASVVASTSSQYDGVVAVERSFELCFIYRSVYMDGGGSVLWFYGSGSIVAEISMLMESMHPYIYSVRFAVPIRLRDKE